MRQMKKKTTNHIISDIKLILNIVQIIIILTFKVLTKMHNNYKELHTFPINGIDESPEISYITTLLL